VGGISAHFDGRHQLSEVGLGFDGDSSIASFGLQLQQVRHACVLFHDAGVQFKAETWAGGNSEHPVGIQLPRRCVDFVNER
jgi:hypothetical protein